MNKKKTFYYDLCIDELNKIKEKNEKPILGIHVCCGPCSAFPLEFLEPYFKIKILYFNPNIYPKGEYDRRLEELKNYVNTFNNEHKSDVEIIEFEYDNDDFMNDLLPLKEEPEGGKRCRICYHKRMLKTYEFADKNHYDYYTTVMTISRQKNSLILNEIGEFLSKKFKTKYLFSDFKKNKGIDRGIELRKKYNMYNQLYCGCKISLDKINDKR